MLFQKDEIKKYAKESSDRRGTGSFRKQWDGGEHMVTIAEVVLGTTKAKNSMLTVHFSKNPDHDLLFANFTLAGPGSEIQKAKLVEFLLKSFNYELQPCKDEQSLLDQMMQFKGKQCRIAVRLQHRLYTVRGGKNKGETVIVKRPEYWYSGHKDDTRFSVKPDKLERPLNDKEMKQYNEIASLTGKAPRVIGEDPDPVSEGPSEPSGEGLEKEENPFA